MCFHVPTNAEWEKGAKIMFSVCAFSPSNEEIDRRHTFQYNSSYVSQFIFLSVSLMELQDVLAP